jgi:adenylate cyclase
MAQTRKLAAILVSDVVGYSRLTGTDEDRILARLRALRSDLIDPIIDVHNGRVVKRTGDGAIVEFRSVVDAVRCAIEVQNGMVERNAGLPPERRIEFRVGIHLGDVVEESDGDLMGDGVNIAARLEGIAKPGTICLSEDAYRQVKSRLDLAVSDLGEQSLKNIADPVRVYSLEVGKPAQAKPTKPAAPKQRSIFALLGVGIVALIVIAGSAWYFRSTTRTAPVASNAPAPAGAARLSIVVLPFANLSGDPAQDYIADVITEELTTNLSRIAGSFVIARSTAFTYKGKPIDVKQVGRDLGVRYVLEGSEQMSGSHVRVSTQLIDAESGSHLWADQFDANRGDLLEMQDEIVKRLSGPLEIRLVDVDAARVARTPPGNLDAQDLALQCWRGASSLRCLAVKATRRLAFVNVLWRSTVATQLP